MIGFCRLKQGLENLPHGLVTTDELLEQFKMTRHKGGWGLAIDSR